MKDKIMLELSIEDGRKVETYLEKKKVSDLFFYPSNPRVGSALLNFQGIVTNDSIHKLMSENKGEAVRTLYQAVKKAHNVNEPLVVYKNQVIEGNTRLWVLRQLYKDTNDPFWTTVNCRVIKGELTDKQLNYLIYHLQEADKKREWEPFEAACYFHKMNKIDNKSIKEITEITELSEGKIRDYIDTYVEMSKRQLPANQFSLIYETLKIKEVKKEFEKDKNTKIIDIVIDQFNEDKIKNAQEVRHLKDVLTCDVARSAFLNENKELDVVYKIAKYSNPTIEDTFLRDLSLITNKISKVPINEISKIQKDKKKVAIVENLYKKVTIFYKKIKEL